jgi:hypothetical protein
MTTHTIVILQIHGNGTKSWLENNTFIFTCI